jgi:hypothetical protein
VSFANCFVLKCVSPNNHEIYFLTRINVEEIPKLKIESPNFKFRMINQVLDYENGSETLLKVKINLALG